MTSGLVVLTRLVVPSTLYYMWYNANGAIETIPNPGRERSKVHIMSIDSHESSCGKLQRRYDAPLDLHFGADSEWIHGVYARSLVTSVDIQGSASAAGSANTSFLRVCKKCFDATPKALLRVTLPKALLRVTLATGTEPERVVTLKSGSDDLSEWASVGLCT